MEYTICSVASIVLLPFAAFVINSFIVKKFSKIAVTISCVAIFLSFCLSLRIFYDAVFNHFASDFHVHKVFNWIDLSTRSSTFKIDIGIYIDNLGAIMLLMVSGVAFLIHIFSTYYMKDDPRFGRFFVYMSLFTSAMLGLVLSDNLLTFFVFWEIMGFCSYSLIGFYYEKEGAGNASLKAFMTTRVGDVFLLVGILAIWSVVGNVTFVDIYRFIGENGFAGKVGFLGMPLATFAAISIFLGTIGKSAQFPLQVWLPDAMFGPTPCSALIHAATMVAAGVFLSLRMYPLMEAGGITYFIACIGGITAVGAATIALIQTDIKAVLAYSTISQLGYMVLGIGVGAYTASFMHLITHAVFKACLFLSAGSVIHSLHDHHTDSHVQDMTRMGGLRKKMPWTYVAMLCCTLAITGMPFFSGFVSKDRILGDALVAATHSSAYWFPAILGYVGAFLTAFYMFRMMFLTFFGETRDKELYDHISMERISWNRNIPLLILTLFTIGAWYCGSFTGQGLKLPGLTNSEWFTKMVVKPNPAKFGHYTRQPFLKEDLVKNYRFKKIPTKIKEDLDGHHDFVHKVHIGGAVLSFIIFLLGFGLAYQMYIRKKIDPAWWSQTFKRYRNLLKNKYHFDTFYIDILIKKGLLNLNKFLAFVDMGIYDKYAVDGWEKVNKVLFTIARKFDDLFIDTVLVDGSGVSVKFFNVILRVIQSGKIQLYIMIIILVLTGYIWRLS